MTILLVALMSISAATLQSHALTRQNRDRTMAMNALRSMSERVHARSQLFAAEPATWAQNMIATFGEGGTIGDSFDVRGLTPLDADASVGLVKIIVNETLTDEEIGGELGMPRDLDGDGLANSDNVLATARLLPVLVQVRWTGSQGEARVSHPFYIMGY